MAEKKLSVKLSLNDKQFQTGLRKATRSMKKFGKSMQKTGKTLSASLTLPVLAFGAASVKAFDEQIKAETKLRTALKGDEKAFESLTKKAAEFQQLSLFGDEELITQQAYLASLGMTEDTINKVLAASMDLAAGTGQTLEFGVKNLAKTFAGLTGELGESIPALKNLTKEELMLGGAVEVVAKQFENQALFLSKVGLGPFKQIQMALSDVSEEFGRLIVENIDPLKEKLQSLVEAFKSLTTEQKQNIIEFAALAAVVGPLLLIIGNLLESISILGKSLMWLNANPMALLLLSVAAFTGALGLAILDLDTFTRSAMKLGRVGKMVASGLLAVLGPNSAEMQAARALLAMDFDDFDSSAPKGTFEKIGPYSGGTLPTTPTTTTTTTTTPTKKGATSFNINKHIPFLDELSYMKQFAEISLAINQSMANLGNIFPFVSREAKTAFETMAEAVSPLESVFASFGSTLQQTFINAMQSTDGFFDSFLEGAKQAIKALIAQIAAMSILTFLLGGTNLGAMMGAGSKGGLAGVQSLFGIGGPVKSMGTSSSGGVEIFGTLSGSDILLSNQRAGNSRNRTSGY